jgi:hypothetical protein
LGKVFGPQYKNFYNFSDMLYSEDAPIFKFLTPACNGGDKVSSLPERRVIAFAPNNSVTQKVVE